ncbi:GRB2-associated-binding protein 2 [Cricetulus griseus]|nr:GRB2-associated-binding protein 2 [Cricetulus griseus]
MSRLSLQTGCTSTVCSRKKSEGRSVLLAELNSSSQPGREAACWSAKSLEKTVVGPLDTSSSDDNYVPTNPSDTASSDDNYVPTNPVSDILMSTMPHHFASRGRDPVTPGQYPPQAWPKSKASINEHPFKSPVTKSWSTVNHTFNYNSSQYRRSISNTDSRDSEKNYVPMQNPMSSSPVSSGTT